MAVGRAGGGGVVVVLAAPLVVTVVLQVIVDLAQRRLDRNRVERVLAVRPLEAELATAATMLKTEAVVVSQRGRRCEARRQAGRVRALHERLVL